MTVPFSDAEASIVPVEFIERNEIGALWACITFSTISFRVEKRIISPDCWVSAAGCVAGEGCCERGVVGEGTGEG